MKTSTKIMMLAGVLALGGGCQHDVEQSYMNPFPPDGQPRRVQTMADAQAAVGAKEDGTLYAWDFDGKELSPLGRQKLDEIACADTAAPLPIYLSVKDDSYTDRKASVVAYLEDKHMTADHIKVINGVNDTLKTPAAAGIAMYSKTDTAEDASAAGTSSSAPSSSASH